MVQKAHVTFILWSILVRRVALFFGYTVREKLSFHEDQLAVLAQQVATILRADYMREWPQACAKRASARGTGGVNFQH